MEVQGQQYDIKKIDSGNIHQCLEFIATNFSYSEHDPTQGELSCCLYELTYEQTLMAITNEKDALLAGIGLAVVNPKNNEIIACMAGYPMNNPPKPLKEIPFQNLSILNDLLHKIEQKGLQALQEQHAQYDKNCAFYSAKGAVNPRYRDLDILKKLQAIYMEAIMKQGYKYVTALCTAPEAQMIFSDCQEVYKHCFSEEEMMRNKSTQRYFEKFQRHNLKPSFAFLFKEFKIKDTLHLRELQKL